MTLGTITQLTTNPQAETALLKLNLQIAQNENRSLKQRLALTEELLKTKTNVCEMQHKLIRLLESQRDAG